MVNKTPVFAGVFLISSRDTLPPFAPMNSHEFHVLGVDKRGGHIFLEKGQFHFGSYLRNQNPYSVSHTRNECVHPSLRRLSPRD